MNRQIAAFAVLLGMSFGTHPAFAWGDEGHQIVALIAEHFLEPGVRVKVRAMLAADPDTLAAHDIASAATWADKYRDSDRRTTHERYNGTHQWHFVDLELSRPDLDTACFGHPRLAPGQPASLGAPARDCIVDKIEQFTNELQSPQTNPEERLIALKFLLHLVGDLHQPLHAADDHDSGGNKLRVTARGIRAGNLHHFWDTEFVERIGIRPDQLAASISEAQRAAWSAGSARDWAFESFGVAREFVYGRLPLANSRGGYHLDDTYVTDATRIVADRLRKAGVRLAALLNRALGAQAAASTNSR
jgi:S1/P1 Nuclease